MWDMRRPHFLLGFDPSLCSQRLNIPCNFVKYMDGRAPGTALLEGPSGNNWFMDLIQLENGFFFNDGWGDFVRDHFLEQGDYVVFRYDGDLHFTVQIFDSTMCEKESAFTAETSQDLSRYDGNIMLKKRDRETSSLFDGVVEGVPKRLRQMQLGSTSDDQESSANVVNALEWLQHGGGNSSMRDEVTVALPIRTVPHDNPDSSVRNRTSKLDMLLSASEAERVARSFTSSFPNFLKVMKRSNISSSYTLNVPYQFATEHLPNCKLKIVLRNVKGESWTVNSIPTTKVQTTHTFCGGWLSFARDNNIDIGDICIFELVSKYVMHVRIVRVGREEIDGEPAHGGRNNGITEKPGIAAKPNKVSKRKTKKKVNGNTRSTKTISLASQSRNCISESDMHKRIVSVDKQGQTKGCMSMKSAPEEKMAAQYFVSNFPHFVRVMKKFNISGSYTLKVPYQFSMEHLPNCRTEIVLRNLNGQCWTVNSVPTLKVQTLHTFCGGWMAFVRDNGVQMGDICIFELIGKCEMRVHVCGIGKKGLNYHNGPNLLMP